MDFHSEMNKLAIRVQAELTMLEEEEEPTALLALKLDNNRGQDVTVTCSENDGIDYLRFCTKVGEVASFSPERLKQMLQLNAGLLRGAFALSEGELVLVDTVDASPLDHDRAGRALVQLARTADQMERAFFGTDRA